MQRLLLLAIAVAVVVVGWPQALGGAASYVVVSGVSMEPTYETGDLVVTRSASEYEVGDVIAFRTEEGGVIHRIIGGDAEEGFQTQGDNVERPDPYLPRPADIRGKALFHLPAVGAWGLRLVQTVPAPLLAAGAILLGLGGTEGRRRRRRSRPTRPISSDRPARTPTTISTTSEDTVNTPLTSRPRFQVAAACVVAAVVVLPSAFLAWRAPATVEVPAAEADVRHELDVTVFGIADRPSSLYPEGRSQPITADADGAVPEDAPALLRSQIDELRIVVRHEVVGAENASGAGRVGVVLRTGRGFELGLNGVPMSQFNGTFHEEVTIALDAVEERFATYLDEADLSNDSFTIEVRPVVAADDGVTMRGGPVVIDPSGDAIDVDGPLRTVATAEGDSATVAATAPLVGIPLPVPLVRGLGTALVAALLLAAAALLRRELRERPDLRIGLLHGSLLVDIEPDANVGGEIVRVTSIAELTRLARRDQRTILHQERADGRHHYMVPDGELTYEYVVDVDGGRATGLGLAMPEDPAAAMPEGVAAPMTEDAPASPPSRGGTSLEVPAADQAGEAPRRVVARDALADSVEEGESEDVDLDQAPAPDTVRDYLPVTPADLPTGRVVVVEDFTELTRIWMQDNAAPGRLQRRRLAHGAMRYSVVRNGREFVYEATPDEDVVAGNRGSADA